MAGNNSGTTSWGVAITLVVFLIIVDFANYSYVHQGASLTAQNQSSEGYNSSSTATYNTTGVKLLNEVAKTSVTSELPAWIQNTIYVMNALVLILVYMLLRGIW